MLSPERKRHSYPQLPPLLLKAATKFVQMRKVTFPVKLQGNM